MTSPTVKSVKRSSAALVVLTLVSGLASYVREMLIAALYGATGITDAYFTAYTLVLLGSDLLLGAALYASCIPVLAPLAQSGTDTLRERQNVIATAGLAIIVASGLTTAVLWAALPWLIALLAPGLNASSTALALNMAHWMLLLLFPIRGLVILFTQALNAHGRFILAASTVPGINLVFCIAIVVLRPILGPDSLLVAVLLGPIITVLVLGTHLRRLGLLRLVWPKLAGGHAATLWRLAWPMLATIGLGSGDGMVLLSHLILRSHASHLGEGAISALGYAFRIYEVPITLAANTTGAILLPTLAALFARGERARIATLCHNALLWGLIILLPAVVVTLVEAHELVNILLRRGNFSAHDVDITAAALRGFAPVIFFESCLFVIFRLFYAVHRPHVPIMFSVGIVICLISLVETMGYRLGITAVAGSLSVTFGLAVITAVFVIRRIFGALSLPTIGSMAVPLATAAVGCFVWYAAIAYMEVQTDSLPVGIIGASTFGLLYFGIVLLVLPKERATLWALISRKR